MTTPTAMRVGLVLGAGGPTGGPFIDAALEVITARTGWRPARAHTLVGTSAGAFVVARIEPADDESSAPRGEAELTALDNSVGWRGSRLDFALAAVRVAVGRMLAAFAPIDRELAAYRVSPEPYHRGAVVVTQHRRGGRAVHPLGEAADPEAVVRASAAIPFMNAPISIGGVWHVDGAVHSPTNSDLIDPVDHDAVVVIAPMIPTSGGSLSDRAHRAQLRAELAPLVRANIPVVVVTPDRAAHRHRRDRAAFAVAGARAAEAL